MVPFGNVNQAFLSWDITQQCFKKVVFCALA